MIFVGDAFVHRKNLLKRNYMRSHIRNQDVESEGLFFLLGGAQLETGINKNATDMIAEMALYGNFIVGNYVDSYRNLTLKTFSDRDQQLLPITNRNVRFIVRLRTRVLILLSGYKYVREFCPQGVKFILFQDDDTIIAEQKFQKLLVSSRTACLAKKYSRAKVIRTDSRGRSEYEVKFFLHW